jgi:hypothetical protein
MICLTLRRNRPARVSLLWHVHANGLCDSYRGMRGADAGPGPRTAIDRNAAAADRDPGWRSRQRWWDCLCTKQTVQSKRPAGCHHGASRPIRCGAAVRQARGRQRRALSTGGSRPRNSGANARRRSHAGDPAARLARRRPVGSAEIALRIVPAATAGCALSRFLDSDLARSLYAAVRGARLPARVAG